MQKYVYYKYKRTQTLQSGVVLFELIVAISIGLIAVGLIIAHGSFLHRVHVRSTLDELYTTCQYLRMKALVEGKAEILTLCEHERSYGWSGAKVTLPTAVMYGTVDGAQGPPSSSLHAIKQPITFAHNQIHFYPMGSIQAGTVYLSDRTRTYGYALTSSVAAYSYLRRYRYDNTWHLVR